MAGLRQFAAQAPEDFSLELIGILELVDQYIREAGGERTAHSIMVAEMIENGAQFQR